MFPDKSSIETDIRDQVNYPKDNFKEKEEEHEKINYPLPGIPNNTQIRQLNDKDPINQSNKNEQIGRGKKRRNSDQPKWIKEWSKNIR